jgi:UDP-arabinose 4-epimerase
MSQPLAYYRVNVGGLVNAVEAMLRHGAHTIVFSSSCATYGLPDTLPIPESAPQRPIIPYGRSKLAGEQILADTHAAEGIRFAILRYFNAAGADPDADLPERHDPETHLIPLAIDAGQGAPLSMFGTDYPTSDGTLPPRLYPCVRACRGARRGARSPQSRQRFAHAQSWYWRSNLRE